MAEKSVKNLARRLRGGFVTLVVILGWIGAVSFALVADVVAAVVIRLRSLDVL